MLATAQRLPYIGSILCQISVRTRMHPVLILLIGIAIVVSGVLAFRLHAFLALTLGALTVAALTPRDRVEQYELEAAGVKVVERKDSDEGQALQLKFKESSYAAGDRILVFRETDGQLQEVAQLKLTTFEAASKTGTAPIPAGVEVRDTDIVAAPRHAAAANKTARQTIGERVAGVFGGMCGKIGILIAMAAIIGKCLLDSGAADRIVRSALALVGEKRAPIAFVGSGFLLGVPVFFDTVFYLMMPLGKAMAMRTSRNYLLYVLTIVAGASMAHSLVPPTPGPLAVAEQLDVDLLMMILGGTLVGLCSSTAAYAYAAIVNRRNELPLRESPDFSLEDLEKLSQQDEALLPPLWLALSPILLPVLLISIDTILKTAGYKDDSVTWVFLLKTLGNKSIALTIAAGIAVGMLVWKRRPTLKELAEAMGAALASGGVIILITAAGGAFGGVLKQTGIVGLIRQIPTGSPLYVIGLAFLVTTAIRTAQGSATVAMLTAGGILAGFASDGQLGCHPVYLALAIGCGSKPIAWMNDSGFWVICKMSGMSEAEGLKYITPMSILMGLTGLAATMLAATVFPMTP